MKKGFLVLVVTVVVGIVGVYQLGISRLGVEETDVGERAPFEVNYEKLQISAARSSFSGIVTRFENRISFAVMEIVIGGVDGERREFLLSPSVVVFDSSSRRSVGVRDIAVDSVVRVFTVDGNVFAVVRGVGYNLLEVGGVSRGEIVCMVGETRLVFNQNDISVENALVGGGLGVSEIVIGDLVFYASTDYELVEHSPGIFVRQFRVSELSVHPRR